MSIRTIEEPIYDQRVDLTLKGLLEGKTREELAESFGLSTWKSLDISLRRKGFTWDSSNKTYIPAINKMDKILDEVSSNTSIKAEQVIKSFKEYGEDSDPKMIAEEMGFDDHKEMAEYMQDNNMTWSMEEGNYIQSFKQDIDITAEDVELITLKDSCDEVSGDEFDQLIAYLPLLKMLGKNKEKLLDLLVIDSKGVIPKYAVPGDPKTKSIYMSDLLSRLMTEFCNTKNISQREVVEGAIVEYLKRHSYKLEVEKLLSKK